MERKEFTKEQYEELKSKYEWFDFVYTRYFKKFKDKTIINFIEDLNKYNQIPIFKANENVHQIMTNYKNRDELPDIDASYIKSTDIVTEGSHWIMRMITQYYITEAFKAMKIDLEDPNIKENVLGKGTPGRLAKMFCGSNPDDTSELGSGRFNREPYISCFPNTDNDHNVITKEVDLISCCSHHFLPFSNIDGGKVIISYIPDKFVLGVSKLQRFVNWSASRFWLQEDLTRYIGEQIKRIAMTEHVYVRLEGIKHSCERFRGVKSKDTYLTTEFKSGSFKKI